MQKTNIIPQIIFEKLRFKKSCNLIGGQHFGLQLENQIFPRHEAFTKSYSQLWASFKTQKVCCPRQNAKYSAFGPNLSRLLSYLDNKYNFPKSSFVTF